MSKKQAMTVVVGLGKTGWSCVEFFVARGVRCAVMDTRSEPPNRQALLDQYPDVPLSDLSKAVLLSAHEVVVSPGVSLPSAWVVELMAAGVSVVSDIDVFLREVSVPVIAVTGSNGKTTVTTLIGDVLREAGYTVAVCGNIGEPVLTTLSGPAPDYYVIELSSFQLASTSTLSGHTAVFLNLTADHLDRHESMASYCAAKQRIFDGACRAVVNRDQPETWSGVTLPMSCVSVGEASPQGGDAYGIRVWNGERYLARGDERVLATRAMRCRGGHHDTNALVVLAVSDGLGVDRSVVLPVLSSFAGLSHRCEWLRCVKGVDWFNDSKATNVGATVAAVALLKGDVSGRLVLIAGGVGKEADFSLLAAAMVQRVSTVWLFGRDAPLIREALGDGVDCQCVQTLAQAVASAAATTQAGDAVLLSPACASFDQFKNFEQRGDCFAAMVSQLPE